MRPTGSIAAALAAALLALTGCDSIDRQPVDTLETTKEKRDRAEGKLFSDDIVLYGRGDEDGGGGGGAGIGVNAWLWRASLDTFAFLPLVSADPFGGVIITDWYTPPESQDERYKATVFILDRALRSDGVRVTVFKQQRDPERGWLDVNVEPETNTQLEDAILTRARQLRIARTES